MPVVDVVAWYSRIQRSQVPAPVRPADWRFQEQSALGPREDDPELPVVHLLASHAERRFDDVVPAAR